MVGSREREEGHGWFARTRYERRTRFIKRSLSSLKIQRCYGAGYIIVRVVSRANEFAFDCEATLIEPQRYIFTIGY